MAKILALAAAALILSCVSTRAQSLLKNGGFETVHTVKGAPTADVGFGVWKLGVERQAPTHWNLNTAYPGECLVLSDGAQSGKRFVRIRATGKRGVAHIYQPCPDLKSGNLYAVSAWARGGKVSIGFYE